VKHYFKKIALNCVTQYLVAVLVYMNAIKLFFPDLHETLLILFYFRFYQFALFEFLYEIKDRKTNDISKSQGR